MNMVMKMKNEIIDFIKKLEIPYKEYDHEPILNYEKARKLANKFNWDGVENKTLLLEDENDAKYIFVTSEKNKVSFNKLKNIFRHELRLVDKNKIYQITGYRIGALPPFGYDKLFNIIIDKRILKNKNIIFTPGDPKKTLIINMDDFFRIFNHIENQVIMYE